MGYNQIVTQLKQTLLLTSITNSESTMSSTMYQTAKGPYSLKGDVEMGNIILNFSFRNAKMSIENSCRLISISVCSLIGGLLGVLVWVLDLPGETERNNMFALTEINSSFLELKVFSVLWMPSITTFRNFMFVRKK